MEGTDLANHGSMSRRESSVAVRRSMGSAPTEDHLYDYDEWASKGAAGWNWSNVLPFFKKLETDADFGEPFHGGEGPMPIQRHRRVGWSGFTRTIAKIFADMGYAQQDDQNGPWVDGVFPTSINLDQHGRRASTALAYLSPEVRRRPNLSHSHKYAVRGTDHRGRTDRRWPSDTR